MAKMFNISEAATLGLHTVVLLAEDPDKMLSINDIVEKIPASKAHLSKVLQRLGKVGIVKSTRGPKGGFILGKKPEEVTLLEVYESIDGPISNDDCLFDDPVCDGNCILDEFLENLNKQIYQTLQEKKLKDLHGTFKE